MEEKVCPCCGRHCNLNRPGCEKGVNFLKNGGTSHCGRGDNPGTGSEKRKKHYQLLDVSDKLLYNIREMGHTVRAFSDGKAGQSRILIMLADCDLITQSELTDLLGVQPGTASEVIGKLEKAGLVLRIANEQDRRTCELRLSERGKEKAAEAAEESRKRVSEMFACLSDSEKEDLLALLEKVNSDWVERYETRKKSYLHEKKRHRGEHYGHGNHRGRFGSRHSEE